MTARYYCLGLPVTVGVDDWGRVTISVDLSEIGDIDEGPLFDYDQDLILADVDVAEQAAERVGNYITTTL